MDDKPIPVNILSKHIFDNSNITRVHIYFTNKSFKPFCADGYEYYKNDKRKLDKLNNRRESIQDLIYLHNKSNLGCNY